MNLQPSQHLPISLLCTIQLYILIWSPSCHGGMCCEHDLTWKLEDKKHRAPFYYFSTLLMTPLRKWSMHQWTIPWIWYSFSDCDSSVRLWLVCPLFNKCVLWTYCSVSVAYELFSCAVDLSFQLVDLFSCHVWLVAFVVSSLFLLLDCCLPSRLRTCKIPIGRYTVSMTGT